MLKTFKALAEVLVAAWIYGTDAMEGDIEFCCGFKSKIQAFWNICWKFVSPTLLAVIICFSLYDLFSGEIKGNFEKLEKVPKTPF